MAYSRHALGIFLWVQLHNLSMGVNENAPICHGAGSGCLSISYMNCQKIVTLPLTTVFERGHGRSAKLRNQPCIPRNSMKSDQEGNGDEKREMHEGRTTDVNSSLCIARVLCRKPSWQRGYVQACVGRAKTTFYRLGGARCRWGSVLVAPLLCPLFALRLEDLEVIYFLKGGNNLLFCSCLRCRFWKFLYFVTTIEL